MPSINRDFWFSIHFLVLNFQYSASSKWTTIAIWNLDRHNCTSPSYPLHHLSHSWALTMAIEGSVPQTFSLEASAQPSSGGLSVSGVPLISGILAPLVSSSPCFSLYAQIQICLKSKCVSYPEVVTTNLWWSNRLQRTFREPKEIKLQQLHSHWDSSMPYTQYRCFTVYHQLLHLPCSIIPGMVRCCLPQSRKDL